MTYSVTESVAIISSFIVWASVAIDIFLLRENEKQTDIKNKQKVYRLSVSVTAMVT